MRESISKRRLYIKPHILIGSPSVDRQHYGILDIRVWITKFRLLVVDRLCVQFVSLGEYLYFQCPWWFPIFINNENVIHWPEHLLFMRNAHRCKQNTSIIKYITWIIVLQWQNYRYKGDGEQNMKRKCSSCHL